MPTIKIVIKDEVNCKLENLDVMMRRKIMSKFTYLLPYARHTPAYKLGRWDGTVKFVTMGGGTYVKLLDEIIPMLDAANYDIEVVDQRHPWQFEFEEVNEQSLSHLVWPKGHVNEGEPIEFRDYQVTALNAFLSEPHCLQEISTGAGKTLITAMLCLRAEKYGRTITIVPNRDLVTQTFKDYDLIGLDVGVFFGSQKDYTKTHTICTWQSLNSLGKRSKDGTAPIEWDTFVEGVNALVVDEAHGGKAEILKAMLTGPFAQVPIRWGLTGTIPKEESDWRGMQVSIGPVVNKIKASDLQEQGVLANCNVNIVQMQDQRTFPNYQAELKYLLSDANRLDYIGKLITNISANGNTLVLVDRIDAGEELIARIPDAVFINGGVKSTKRADEYGDVATATNKVIVATYGVASVGINIPRIFNLVLIEPGKSFIRTIQSIGRGLRKAQDKDSVEIWDITSSCKYSKRHLTKRKEFYKEAKYNYTVEKVSVDHRKQVP